MDFPLTRKGRRSNFIPPLYETHRPKGRNRWKDGTGLRTGTVRKAALPDGRRVEENGDALVVQGVSLGPGSAKRSGRTIRVTREGDGDPLR